MNIVSSVNEWRAIRDEYKHKTIGVVPTMGHLHAGHVRLCEYSKKENDLTVTTIFVNPTQFNNPDDLAKYPRTLDNDIEILTKHNVDFLFLPNADEMYADNYEIQINETVDSKQLEGEFRPGHFNGVLTVVLKLLNIIQATRAYFGEKDYQQLLLIKKMAAALFVPTKIIPVETVRAENNFALSSRNSRLTKEQLEYASIFPQLLNSDLDVTEIKERLVSLGFKVDYIADKWGRRLGAIWLGDVRLIDNVELEEITC